MALAGDGVPSGLQQPVYTSGAVIMMVGIILFGLSFLAPIAVYYERKHLPKDQEWYPSRWYYLMFFPDGIIAFILSIMYTRRRRKHFGDL